MISLFLLISVAFVNATDSSQGVENYPYGKVNKQANFGKAFDSSYNSYQVQRYAESGVFSANQENYVRAKCKTCCRVIFASDYNYKTKKQFTNADDVRGDTRYVMDMEFDDKRSVRYYQGQYEQNILLRPLKMGNELQFFEFAPYKMYTSFSIPRRVHDIRGGANRGATLIIWMKKAPLDPGTNNQRFVYVHPYKTEWYLEYSKTNKWPSYSKHFYLPFSSNNLCYQAKSEGQQRSTWTGNAHLTTTSTSYQIEAASCVANEPRQIFIPVFA
ncbi:galactose-inhibitable lectin 35 kDa subunit precursor, putative [Entamoeba dispar SAW760]|uniref:Galactose-inhibitable lectin 35 kDa subunit, putative n=1 Tax=Entamoeba dispar (strain ATCC PRA-260 / SAW760) TaxID=370354 RepID=B0EMF0_ENTDS|nr:galactose-inhibitable lectin 35 kDa subunit precursor, putative [Entamoeba dispar SAW760]EDR24296.1 galactose-inhibitable lectin 35 kDa subunit precursor, putative [Entamoeba dispar SAW760]|eukprot:EDR24296.1 galactose-inhibitable lectin 35 kDa subunit precursor, putative [Entamoeba dispar SAW760]